MIRAYRTAIVTGASRGVGVYFASALATAGMNLVLAARNTEDLNRAASEIDASGGRALAVPTDVTDRNALE